MNSISEQQIRVKTENNPTSKEGVAMAINDANSKIEELLNQGAKRFHLRPIFNVEGNSFHILIDAER